MPGSRCRNGRIALKRWVTAHAPRSKAAFACAAVASLWPSETATPRSRSRSISSPAPGSSGARVISRTGPASRRRSRSARSGSRRAEASWVPSLDGREERALEVHPEDPGPRLVDRHLAHRGEHLRLGGRDQRREIGGDAGLEQRGPGPPVPVGVGVEEVDAAEAVHLQVDESRHCEAAPDRRRRGRRRRFARRPPRRLPAAAGPRRALLRLRVSSPQSMRRSVALVNTSFRFLRRSACVLPSWSIPSRIQWPRSGSQGSPNCSAASPRSTRSRCRSPTASSSSSSARPAAASRRCCA